MGGVLKQFVIFEMEFLMTSAHHAKRVPCITEIFVFLASESPYSSSARLYPKKAAVWRSLKGTGNAHLESPLAKTPRQLWLGSLKQGMEIQSLSASRISWGGGGVFCLTLSLFLTLGYIPGTPDYKEKEDMYDEIIELKKTIHTQKCEGDRMKTKLRRLEEENSRKDRQIEQLLDPSRGFEFAQTLTEKKNDTSWVMNGLKQKILKLEQQCKEKDNTINKFQTDVRTTNLEEMKIAMETYYEEIHRLQILLAKSEAEGRKSSSESRESQKRQKVLNAAVLRLSRNIKELQDENQSLKADLDRALSSSLASSTVQKESHTGDPHCHPICTLASGDFPPRPSPACTAEGKEEQRKEQAAQLIQRQWKTYKNKVTFLQAAVVLQSNALGRKSPNMHNPGNKVTNSDMSHNPSALSLAAESKDEEEAVTVIQSVFRAHLARKEQPAER
uniref:IQ domain-containing protein E n=1 Tax=Sphenodon punctatus TaxID=8508 RepID=A0A8D0G3U1_SPHPU